MYIATFCLQFKFHDYSSFKMNLTEIIATHNVCTSWKSAETIYGKDIKHSTCECDIVKYETNLTFLKCECNKSKTCNKSFSQQKSNRYVDLQCKCKHTSYCKQTVLLIYEDTCYWLQTCKGVPTNHVSTRSVQTGL